MNKLPWCVIDFETKDPHISLKHGPGWPYHDVMCLGAAIKIPEYKTWYETDLNKIKQIAERAEILIGHNAMYDVGLLIMLGVDVSKKTIVDTALMARRYNNLLPQFSLEFLSRVLLKERKEVDLLVEIAKILNRRDKKDFFKTTEEGNLYMDYPLEGVQCYLSPIGGRWKKAQAVKQDKKAKKWIYENMDIAQYHFPEFVAKYAIADANLCYQLYVKFKQVIPEEIIQRDSDILQTLMAIRKKGIRVDLKQAKAAEVHLTDEIEKARKYCIDTAGFEFNFKSSMQLIELAQQRGWPLTVGKTGNPSLTKDFLESHQEVPFYKALLTYRKNIKALEFITKIFEIQQYVKHDDNYGIIYPSLYPAAKTGRFTHQGPNISQLPSHDPEISRMIRSIIVPYEGDKYIVAADFNNQEGRLQVHFAAMEGMTGTTELVNKFYDDPYLDMHKLVAEMMNTDRGKAKVINLGMSYGMGLFKLAKGLKVTEKEAEQLRNLYNEKAPYLNELMKKCIFQIKDKGYVETLAGRRVKVMDDYKGINAKVQGSAYDQTAYAMILAHKAGLRVLTSVHDEIIISCNTREEAEMLVNIMETCYFLMIPVKVGKRDEPFKLAPNWYEAKV